MSILQFIIIASFCLLETIFFNQALFEKEYLIALLWGFLLYRDLKRVYIVSKFTDNILKITKKKD
ncbi:DUF3272 family protein [Streptococcus cuniculipharyngis]|uniref:DUF3272 family protein n=1 Tax=Streptococcus cuniculipharyngis TaxID=1562651 RepID=A0A5C5SCM5_9STRE|nr:DUF3272 family protein [Streptococcus cuniculipharyngis]TWS98706.1 DUF3272 family protein [Streptococcus cuniculipharyngis]